ncbi:unnamed protein product [Sympodiomycopsis kandeliae]
MTATPKTLPTSLSSLFAREASTIPLVPSKPFSSETKSTIETLSTQNKWDDALTSSLHLLNDDVSKAHDIVTDREDDEACCLVHAILHRREGDYWNSKYWYSRISHPFVNDFYGSRQAAKSFVDEVESVAKGTKKGTASSACGASNLLNGIKSKQEEELKSLVSNLWQERGL